MHLVKPQEHKFAALHGAVWSGGSFVYVPKGVSVTIPLQSYFRLNAPGAGQFEHTLIIVDEGAYLHFIEGSISFAMVTPSLVMSGAPKDLSRTTFLPFGPNVTLTVSAN